MPRIVLKRLEGSGIGFRRMAILTGSSGQVFCTDVTKHSELILESLQDLCQKLHLVRFVHRRVMIFFYDQHVRGKTCCGSKSHASY